MIKVVLLAYVFSASHQLEVIELNRFDSPYECNHALLSIFNDDQYDDVACRTVDQDGNLLIRRGSDEYEVLQGYDTLPYNPPVKLIIEER